MSKLFVRRLIFVLMLMIGCIAMPRFAHAQSVICASPTIGNVSFGAVNVTSGTVNVNGTINWSCTSAGVPGVSFSPAANIALCLSLNAGTGGAQTDPRQLSNGSGTLQYQLYQDAADSTPWSTATASLGIAVAIGGGRLYSTTVTGQTPFYAQLPGGQTTAAVGTYSSTLTASVSGAYTLNTNGSPASCTSGPNILTVAAASFVTSATVQKACTVSASNINLGAVASTAVNVTANTTLNVTCSNGTPYYVGLTPSNGNSAGSGSMTGALTGNTSQVPYQLSSTPAPGGIAWGNTATTTSVGNGVAGTGTGLSQLLTVYAIAPSANYTPDSYSDVVTVNVNY